MSTRFTGAELRWMLQHSFNWSARSTACARSWECRGVGLASGRSTICLKLGRLFMKYRYVLLTFLLCCLVLAAEATAQTGQCPIRPGSGVLITDPTVLHSVNGTLKVALTIYTDLNIDGST